MQPGTTRGAQQREMTVQGTISTGTAATCMDMDEHTKYARIQHFVAKLDSHASAQKNCFKAFPGCKANVAQAAVRQVPMHRAVWTKLSKNRRLHLNKQIGKLYKKRFKSGPHIKHCVNTHVQLMSMLNVRYYTNAFASPRYQCMGLKDKKKARNEFSQQFRAVPRAHSNLLGLCREENVIVSYFAVFVSLFIDTHPQPT